MLKSKNLALACFMVAASATAQAEPAKLPTVQEKPALLFPDGALGRPSFLKTLRSRHETPASIVGESQTGLWCSRVGDIVWDQKSHNFFTQGLPQAFRAELEKAHYPVVKQSDSMFEETKEKPKTTSDLQVGALIKEVKTNFCVKSDKAVIGAVYVKVFWQVFAPDQQKVVLEATTEGVFQTENPEKVNPSLFFARAFGMATRNLLAETSYTAAITATVVDHPETITAYKDVLKINAGHPYTEPLSKNITVLRTAVVTVVADGGSGSGFFVSQDGYLLTNRHVVGTSKFVKVKLPTGRELVGEVVRSDALRDVALVKTEPIAVQPMALRDSELNIGEEVYAIGSPLGDKFNTTLTRGILSGYRSDDNIRYLQSDVSVLPGSSGGPLLDAQGSVVGITRGGVAIQGMPVGMNFFIPISEALIKLSIEATH